MFTLARFQKCLLFLCFSIVANPYTNAATYFWVGGNGNWSDLSHWATTSGGNTFHTVLPTSMDDVIFDENSFSTLNPRVNIDLLEVFCKDMDFEKALFEPELAGDADNSLFISGSLNLTSEMILSFSGTWQFSGDNPGQTINLAGHTIPKQVIFDARNGEWLLEGDFKVFDRLTLLSGSLISQDFNIEAQHFNTSPSAPKKLILGKSIFNITARDPADQSVIPSWSMNMANLELEAQEATIHFTERAEGIFLNSNGAIAHIGKVIFNCHFTQFLFGNPSDRVDSLIFKGSAYLNDRSINGNRTSIGYLELGAGYTYTFGDVDYLIDEIQASGDCSSGLIYMNALQKGTTNRLSVTKSFTFQNLALQDIHQEGSGSLIAENSLNLGNNKNWQFTASSQRQLFWVGDSGLWEDPQNWSLSSGGPGGNCIPTALDDVIFDENSFSEPGATISSQNQLRAHVNNMTFINVPNITLENFYLTIYKDLNLVPGIAMDVLQTEFRGAGDNRVQTAGNFFRHNMIVNVESGSLFLDNHLFVGGYLYFFQGNFISNGYDMEANNIHMGFGMSNIDFDRSYITINYDGQYWGLRSNDDMSGVSVVSTNFTMEFKGRQTAIQLFYDRPFGHLYFSDPDGDAEVFSANANFRKLTFAGNGSFFLSDNRMDSLIMSAGKSYILSNDFNQQINNYWQILGTPCAPISLEAQSNSGRANVIMPESGTLLANFIQMKRIAASGGNTFKAGDYSVNLLNSNTGWIFNPESINLSDGFLGPDRLLCPDSELIINATIQDPNISYLWSDGSSGQNLFVDQGGTYSLNLIFSDTCTLMDTLTITPLELASNILPNDTSICKGDSLLVNADVGNNQAIYSWNDGTIGAINTLSTEGSYRIDVQLSECSIVDSITIELINLPELAFLNPDTLACQGDTITLTAQYVPTNELFWFDGSMEPEINVAESGSYWVEVFDGQCINQQTINIEFREAPELTLGPDTLITCSTEVIILNSGGIEGRYLWQDGSTTNNYIVEESGRYSLIVGDGACRVADDIYVSFIDCEDAAVYVPNIFSPNGDGINDEFKIFTSPDYEILEYQLQLFDRWGALIFMTNDINNAWNGNWRGELSVSGTYIYQLELTYRDFSGEKNVKKHGELVLSR